METNQIVNDKETITFFSVLEIVDLSYYTIEKAEENILTDIENLKLKKAIREIEKMVEISKEIPEVYEEYLIALEHLKSFTEEQFEKLKEELKEYEQAKHLPVEEILK